MMYPMYAVVVGPPLPVLYLHQETGAGQLCQGAASRARDYVVHNRLARAALNERYTGASLRDGPRIDVGD